MLEEGISMGKSTNVVCPLLRTSGKRIKKVGENLPFMGSNISKRNVQTSYTSDGFGLRRNWRHVCKRIKTFNKNYYLDRHTMFLPKNEHAFVLLAIDISLISDPNIGIICLDIPLTEPHILL